MRTPTVQDKSYTRRLYSEPEELILSSERFRPTTEVPSSRLCVKHFFVYKLDSQWAERIYTCGNPCARDRVLCNLHASRERSLSLGIFGDSGRRKTIVFLPEVGIVEMQVSGDDRILSVCNGDSDLLPKAVQKAGSLSNLISLLI